MIIFIFLLMIAALALVLYGVSLSSRRALGDELLSQAAKKQKMELRFSDTLTKIFPFTQRFLGRTGLDAKLKSNLDAAHVHLRAFEFFNIKLLSVIGLSVGSILVLQKFDPVVFLVCAAVGYIVPDFLLKRKVAKRKYMIARVLPETVDLLSLCIEAGLDFTSAVKWVIEKTPNNPMVEELAFVLEEIKWGKPRIQALKDMSRRLDISEVSSFVQTIIQAERMGTPVAEAFTILSEDARAQRFHRGERIALQAPIKILIPLIFCIMPVIGIVIGGPIILQFMTGGLTAAAR